MKQHWGRGWLGIATVMVAAGCAINDLPAPTFIPVTTGPMPTLIVAGTCEQTPELELWLQTFSISLDSFQRQMDEAEFKSTEDIGSDIRALTGIRDNLIETTSPDCGTVIHRQGVDTMTSAVNALEDFQRDSSSNLSAALETIRLQFQSIETERLALIERLNQQLDAPP